jgi:RNA polymerase sigma-70 factor (ECF subfamily)
VNAAPGIEATLREHAGMLARIAAGYASNRAARDDLLQEMSVAVWKALPAWRGDGSLKAFVARVAQYAALDGCRRDAQAPTDDIDDVDVVATAAVPDEAAHIEQRRERLAAAIRQLPLGQRECVLLVLEGFTSAEIANVVGVGVNTVDRRLSRARAALRERLREDER